MIKIKWPASEVFMIKVRVEDEFGRFAEHKLVPWSVEIPHTEINFDSGKWDIKNDEAPKLDDAVAVAFHELIALDKVNKAVGAQLTPQLYIVGYTDTVGNAGKNQKLSNSRAKQIAEYFYDKGFWAEIYFAGMGERGLRVETGDSVDEVRNRRALYLIGVQRPAGGGQIPTNWKKLSGSREQPMGFTPPPLPPEWADYREKRRDDAAQGEGGDGGASEDGGDNPGSDLSGWEDRDKSDLDVVGVSGGDDGDYGDGGPPPIEGDPGASKKGCSVGGYGSGTTVALGLLALFALPRRRRQPAPQST